MNRFWRVMLGVGLALSAQSLRAADYLAYEQVTPEIAGLLAKTADETMQAQVQKRAPTLPPLPEIVTRSQNGVCVTLLRGGAVLGSSSADTAQLPGNLSLAVRRSMEAAGQTDLKGAAVVLHLLLAPVTVDPSHEPLPFLQPTMGTEAFRFTYRGVTRFIPPLDPVWKRESWRDLLLRVARDLEPKTAPDQPDSAKTLRDMLVGKSFFVERMRAVTIAKAPGLEPRVLFRCGRVVAMDEVTPDTLRASIAAGVAWLARAPRENGVLAGLIDPVQERQGREKSLTEDALQTLALARLWQAGHDETVRKLAQESLDALVARGYRENDEMQGAYFKDDDDIAVGPAAAVLMAAARLGLGKDNPDWMEKSRRLAVFLMRQCQADGRIAPFFYPPQKTDREGLNGGLGQSALLYWAAVMEDTSGTDAMLVRFRYYDAWFQKNLKQAPYALFPWQAEVGAALYQTLRRQELADSPLRMAQLLVRANQVTTSQAPDRLGAFIGGAEAEGLAPGAWLQGLCGTLTLARQTGASKELEMLRGGILRGARHILQLQLRDPYDAVFVADAEAGKGAFRIAADDLRIRTSWVAQNLAGLSAVLQTLKPEDYAPLR